MFKPQQRIRLREQTVMVRLKPKILPVPAVALRLKQPSTFLTVTSIAIASPVAGSTVDIGTVDEVVE